MCIQVRVRTRIEKKKKAHIPSRCTHYRSKYSGTNTGTHKLNRTEHNQTTDNINMTMCAQTVSLRPDSLPQILSTSLSTHRPQMHVMHAALSHTAPIVLTQADHIMSPLVIGYPPTSLIPSSLFSSHLSSAFLSVCLFLSPYRHLYVPLPTVILL